MNSVYVLRSLKNGKRYVGFTSKSMQERLRQHKSGSSQWTKQNGPFELVHQETYADSRQAKLREKFLKSGQGRKWLDQNF